MTLPEIESRTGIFAVEHRALGFLINKLETELAALKARHIVNIGKQFTCTANAKLKLSFALQQNPGLFEKPRTRVFDGVKVGYQKQKGSIIMADEPTTIARMQKILGDDEAAHYLNVKVTVNKTAINDMPAETMRKLGIELTADTDAIIIKPMDSALEKSINALLADVTSELKQAA